MTLTVQLMKIILKSVISKVKLLKKNFLDFARLTMACAHNLLSDNTRTLIRIYPCFYKTMIDTLIFYPCNDSEIYFCIFSNSVLSIFISCHMRFQNAHAGWYIYRLLNFMFSDWISFFLFYFILFFIFIFYSEKFKIPKLGFFFEFSISEIIFL